ncbi:MAG: fructose 1,6-bisphosphatase [Chloroflexi bacterium]|nr:fructose 1,6-bisphosphatase [Chloroflexota bacterium]
MFDDPDYVVVRHECIVVASILRQHGPFEPHRLSLDEMEYTTMPKLMEKFHDRFESLDGHRVSREQILEAVGAQAD